MVNRGGPSTLRSSWAALKFWFVVKQHVLPTAKQHTGCWVTVVLGSWICKDTLPQDGFVPQWFIICVWGLYATGRPRSRLGVCVSVGEGREGASADPKSFLRQNADHAINGQFTLHFAYARGFVGSHPKKSKIKLPTGKIMPALCYRHSCLPQTPCTWNKIVFEKRDNKIIFTEPSESRWPRGRRLRGNHRSSFFVCAVREKSGIGPPLFSQLPPYLRVPLSTHDKPVMQRGRAQRVVSFLSQSTTVFIIMPLTFRKYVKFWNDEKEHFAAVSGVAGHDIDTHLDLCFGAYRLEASTGATV